MTRLRSRHSGPILLAAVLFASCDSSVTSPDAALDADRFIVVLKESIPDAQTAIDELIATSGADERFLYTDGVIQGFAGRIPEKGVERLRADERVEYVTPVQPVEVFPVSQSIYGPSAGAQVRPWGIDSVDAELSSTRAGDGKGSVGGVHVYVLDTGIAEHPDLNVVRRVNFAGGVNTDCNGHGTHVAGTAAARDNTTGVVGVAPGARLYSIKVLDCSGAGTSSAVVKGVNWVVKNARRPAVVNMSLGAGAHAVALHDAVARAIQQGIVFVVAAGNSNVNAGKVEPAHLGAAITVGAVRKNLCKARFSNWGKVVDLFAPGENILSTWLNGGLAVSSGTSMAAPHVAGGAALILSRSPSLTPAQVRSRLVNRARSVVQCGFTTAAQDSLTTDRMQNMAAF